MKIYSITRKRKPTSPHSRLKPAVSVYHEVYLTKEDAFTSCLNTAKRDSGPRLLSLGWTQSRTGSRLRSWTSETEKACYKVYENDLYIPETVFLDLVPVSL